jgi:hypothetical protein
MFDSLDNIAWNNMVQARLEQYSNKKERQAFLTGLSMGARLMGSDERQRACQELSSLWGIELELDGEEKPKSPMKTTGRINRANVQIDTELLGKLSSFLNS